MTKQLRYLALSLLISTGINAAETNQSPVAPKVEVKQDVTPPVTQPPAPQSKPPVVTNDSYVEFLKNKMGSFGGTVKNLVNNVYDSTKDMSNEGIAKVASFVKRHPVKIAAGASAATVVAVYALIKWRKAAHRAAALEEKTQNLI